MLLFLSLLRLQSATPANGMPACARPRKPEAQKSSFRRRCKQCCYICAKRAPACSPRRERLLRTPALAFQSRGCPPRGVIPSGHRSKPSARTLDHARLAAIPARHPQLRNDADLAPGRPDKVHPETEDGLVDGGVGPCGGVFVLGFEHAARVETAVVDTVPAELVDGAQELEVVLLVGGDEDCGAQTGGQQRGRVSHAHQSQLTFCIPRRVRQQRVDVLCVPIDRGCAVFARRAPGLRAKQSQKG